jgi:hypothetical protein
MPRLILKMPGADPVEIPLPPGVIRMGRHENNDIVIDDPSISEFHCEIEVAGAGALVRDLNSTNGTFIGEDLITSGHLRPGQWLTLGSVMMQFGGEAAPVRAPAGRVISSGSAARPTASKRLPPASLGALLGQSFTYPFKGNGGLIILVGVLMFSLANGAMYLASYAFILGLFAILFITVFCLGYIFKYMQNVVLTTINGDDDPPGWPPIESAWDDLVVPAIRLVVIGLLLFGPGLYVSANVSPRLGLGVTALGLLCLPMVLLTVSLADGINGLNPIIVFSGIVKVLGSYLAICGVVLAFFTARMGVNALLDAVPIPVLATVLNNLIMVYGLTALMRAMGLLYLGNKDRLSWFRH